MDGIHGGRIKGPVFHKKDMWEEIKIKQSIIDSFFYLKGTLSNIGGKAAIYSLTGKSWLASLQVPH